MAGSGLSKRRRLSHISQSFLRSMRWIAGLVSRVSRSSNTPLKPVLYSQIHANNFHHRAMSGNNTVKTRLLIISDTHCAPLQTRQDGDDSFSTAFTTPLPSADVLIHCGDLTRQGKIHEFHAALDMLREIDAPIKLVIAGNHDKLLDRDYVMAHAGRTIKNRHQLEEEVKEVQDLWSSHDGRAVADGITYLTEGSHRINLANGASLSIYASPYTPEFYDWAFPYERDEDRFNPPELTLSDAKNIASDPIPSYTSASHPVDLLITHGPPWARLDLTYRQESVGCPHTLRALMRARPLVHCFGHIHEGWGAEKIRWAESTVVDELVRTPCTTEEWKDGHWQEGVTQIKSIEADLEAAKTRHAAFVDVSSDGRDGALERGWDTLLVNASIMNIRYRPVNAPWVVDVDLPKSEMIPA